MNRHARNLLFLFLVAIAAIGCYVTQKQDQTSNSTPSSLDQGSSCQHTETSLNCVTVVDVHDGDTFFVNIPDAPPPFRKRIGVRIFGIDTPEISSKDPCEKRKAEDAKLVLESQLKKAKRVDVTNVQRDKYFRILGSVIADGKDVSEELLKQRLAYPYHGEKKIKRDWCE